MAKLIQYDSAMKIQKIQQPPIDCHFKKY